jgi:DNA-binding MarR family transcriptional regulator
LADRPSHLLHRAQQVAADAFAAHFPRSELTVRQFAILSAVAAQPGLTQSKLVRVTGVDRSTLADLIARLQERGLVLRDRVEQDGRAKSVTLTLQGEAALVACAPAAEAADAAILDALPKSKRAVFLALLQQVITELDARERKRAKKRARESREAVKKQKKKRKKQHAEALAPEAEAKALKAKVKAAKPQAAGEAAPGAAAPKKTAPKAARATGQ